MSNNNVLNYQEHPDSTGDNIYNFNGTIKIGGTALTSTAAELNKLDGATVSATQLTFSSTAAEIDLQCDKSAQTETIDSGVAVSVTKRITNIDNTTSGAGAITLAAPDSSMLGVVKVIEMTVDGGDVTLALTNVQGGSAATTATFSAVGQQLVLVGGSAKWTVIGEGGVVLS